MPFEANLLNPRIAADSWYVAKHCSNPYKLNLNSGGDAHVLKDTTYVRLN